MGGPAGLRPLARASHLRDRVKCLLCFFRAGVGNGVDSAPLTALHKPPLLIAAAAAPLQTSQAPTGAPRPQAASTCSAAPSPAHPVKLRAQTAAQASALGPSQPQPQAPSHPAGQSTLPQGLLLTSQAQARLPSKWPRLSGRFCPSSPRKPCSGQWCQKPCCPLLSPHARCCLCHAVLSGRQSPGPVPRARPISVLFPGPVRQLCFLRAHAPRCVLMTAPPFLRAGLRACGARGPLGAGGQVRVGHFFASQGGEHSVPQNCDSLCVSHRYQA